MLFSLLLQQLTGCDAGRLLTWQEVQRCSLYAMWLVPDPSNLSVLQAHRHRGWLGAQGSGSTARDAHHPPPSGLPSSSGPHPALSLRHPQQCE
jgi:hypothetical protein